MLPSLSDPRHLHFTHEYTLGLRLEKYCEEGGPEVTRDHELDVSEKKMELLEEKEGNIKIFIFYRMRKCWAKYKTLIGNLEVYKINIKCQCYSGGIMNNNLVLKREKFLEQAFTIFIRELLDDCLFGLILSFKPVSELRFL